MEKRTADEPVGATVFIKIVSFIFDRWLVLGLAGIFCTTHLLEIFLAGGIECEERLLEGIGPAISATVSSTWLTVSGWLCAIIVFAIAFPFLRAQHKRIQEQGATNAKLKDRLDPKRASSTTMSEMEKDDAT